MKEPLPNVLHTEQRFQTPPLCHGATGMLSYNHPLVKEP